MQFVKTPYRLWTVDGLRTLWEVSEADKTHVGLDGSKVTFNQLFGFLALREDEAVKYTQLETSPLGRVYHQGEMLVVTPQGIATIKPCWVTYDLLTDYVSK